MILDTFYLLFKSNADDVVKGNKAVEKSTKDTERALKNTNDQTKEIGQNFVKMIESISGAVGAIAGVEILKNGVQQAINMNTQWKLLGENVGMTAEQLRRAGEASKLAGGSMEEGMSDALLMAKANLVARVKERDPAKMFQNLRSRVAGMDNDQKYQWLERFGLSQSGIRRASVMSDQEYFSDAAESERLARGTNAAADAAYAANKSEVKLSGETQSFFSRLLIAISEPLNAILNIMQSVVGSTGAGVGAAAVVAGETAVGLGVGKVILGAIRKAPIKTAAGAVARTALEEAPKVAGGAFDPAAFGGAWAVEGAAGLGAAALLGIGSLMTIGAGMAGYGMYKGYGEYTKAVDAARAWARNRKRKGTLAQTFNLPAPPVQSVENNAGLSLPFDEHSRAAMDVSGIPTTQELMNSGAVMKDLDRARGVHKSIQKARSTLTAASRLSPASGGSGGANIHIDKIDVITQATDADGVATGIAGALENKFYTALGFLAGTVDNGQSR